MGKTKRKLSELKAQKLKLKKHNPFEVHVNRQKFNILGRKIKSDRGLPGLARQKAIKKRKETLLQEYRLKDKSNRFHDRRIGEKNTAMTHEDRIIARFTAERMKHYQKADAVNLSNSEIITHKGKSLLEIENFEDPISDDDADMRGLNANFVEEAHFGEGGIFRKCDTSRASIIDQLIADSKKRKAERQLAKEKNMEKTEELDAEWKELLPIVNMNKPLEEEKLEKKDAYDVIVNELKFEPRGTASGL